MRCAIIITGPSAVGKTAVTRLLLPILAQETQTLAVIHGDFLSNITHPFTVQPNQLDLKYRNMVALIENLATEGYLIIINDLCRRSEDAKLVTNLLERLGYRSLTLHLQADPETLRSRNRCRDPLDYIPAETMEKEVSIYYSCPWPGEVVIDTRQCTLRETFTIVWERICTFLREI